MDSLFIYGIGVFNVLVIVLLIGKSRLNGKTSFKSKTDLSYYSPPYPVDGQVTSPYDPTRCSYTYDDYD